LKNKLFCAILTRMTEKKEEPKKDEEIKEFCQERAIRKANEVALFLERVALNDKAKDVRMVRRKDTNGEWVYEEVPCAISMNVRVTAAKTWKEMIFDKSIGDIKEKAKEPRRQGIDMKSALEAISKAKAEARQIITEEPL